MVAVHCRMCIDTHRRRKLWNVCSAATRVFLILQLFNSVCSSDLRVEYQQNPYPADSTSENDNRGGVHWAESRRNRASGLKFPENSPCGAKIRRIPTNLVRISAQSRQNRPKFEISIPTNWARIGTGILINYPGSCCDTSRQPAK
jgi:hypothetical protein